MSLGQETTVLVEVRCLVCDRPHLVNLPVSPAQIEFLREMGLDMHVPPSGPAAQPLGCSGCLRYRTTDRPSEGKEVQQ